MLGLFIIFTLEWSFGFLVGYLIGHFLRKKKDEPVKTSTALLIIVPLTVGNFLYTTYSVSSDNPYAGIIPGIVWVSGLGLWHALKLSNKRRDAIRDKNFIWWFFGGWVAIQIVFLAILG